VSIIDLQHRQRELGRIRMGERGAKGQPVRLDKFRLTSPARHLLEAAAALWGGEVREWTDAPTPGQYELYTQTDTLPIVIPPGREPVSSFYETWSAGGCTHRCDGMTNVISDSPCSCDPDKRSCKATTRVNVMLPDLPDIGVWRLESHGINAAMELPGTISVILMASDAGKFLPGRLRIEQRMAKKDGRTNRFSVPVIDLDVTSRALMAGEQPALDASETKFIEASPTLSRSAASAIAAEAGVGHAHVVQVESPAPVVGSDAGDSPDTKAGTHIPAGRDESSASVSVSAADGSPTITQKQIGQMMATAREHNVSEDDLKTLVMDIAKVPSRKLIPADRFLTVIEAIRNWGTWQAELAPERKEDVG
jgi:hypothetical protein